MYVFVSLTSVEFSNALTAIGDHAFDGCSLLGYAKDYTLNFPASVTTVGAKAFYDCKELKAVDFSGSAVKDLKEYTFYGCEKLASVKLNANSNLALGVFAACEALTEANVENLASATGADQAFDVVA